MHSETTKALRQTLLITSIYFVAEYVGGMVFNSLALVADSGHMALDILAILIGLWAAKNHGTPDFERKERLAVRINGITLIAIAVLTFWEAILIIQDPRPVQGLGTLLVAFGGLVVNFISMKILESHHEHSLNARGVWLHVVSDLLGSIAAILSGICVTVWQWYIADPIFSMVIAILIFWSGVNLLKTLKKTTLEPPAR